MKTRLLKFIEDYGVEYYWVMDESSQRDVVLLMQEEILHEFYNEFMGEIMINDGISLFSSERGIEVFLREFLEHFNIDLESVFEKYS